MLSFDPEERIDGQRALNDIWIMKFSNLERVETNDILGSMKRLQEFKVESELQKAVWSYMSERFITSEQEKKAREVFLMLDTNNDGELSKEELFEGYKVIIGDQEEAKARVEVIMEKLDMNKNGSIDYKEFLVANFQDKELNNQKMMRQAFDFFDEVYRINKQDGNGQISTEEIKRIFNSSSEDNIIVTILKDADLNNDNQISYEEFVEAMNRFVLETEDINDKIKLIQQNIFIIIT